MTLGKLDVTLLTKKDRWLSLLIGVSKPTLY